MKTQDRPTDSLWSLSLDLLSAKALVWVASVGRDADLTPQAHMYFFDRYRRLAAYHRARGREAKARRFQAKAAEHFRIGGGGDDGPPYAAALAMPRPKRWLMTDAVSRSRLDGPDDAAERTPGRQNDACGRLREWRGVAGGCARRRPRALCTLIERHSG